MFAGKKRSQSPFLGLPIKLKVPDPFNLYCFLGPAMPAPTIEAE